MPLVSVVMPVWNGERYLKGAIESILEQTFRAFEFLIIDDGSTDSTPAILEGYAASDSRIRLIRLEHVGIVVALNRAVDEARGRWIARMDCDDVALRSRLERQVEALQSSQAELCHTHIKIIGDPRWVTPSGRFIRTRALLGLRMCFQCPIVHPTVMFRRDVFHDLGGYLPDERHAEDYGLWTRFLKVGRVVGIAEPMLEFRVHSESISKKKAETQEMLARRIAIRNCEYFLRLDQGTAEKAYEILRRAGSGRSFVSWMWFLTRCLPRARWRSLEMLAWVLSRTWQVVRCGRVKRPNQ